MSPERPDPERLEKAIREAFEAALPSLVKDALARLDVTPAGRGLPARSLEIGPLFDAARAGGEAAVRALLERPVEDLRSIARSLDRNLGAKARRWKEASRVRDAIVAEILRRAWRNDVFLGSSGGAQSTTEGSKDPDRSR